MKNTPIEVTIPTWANGPDESGNGGWSAGLLAQYVDKKQAQQGVSVALRVPPPLGRLLHVQTCGDNLQLLDNHDNSGSADQPTLVAEASACTVSLEVPPEVLSIRADDAQKASIGFPFRDRHPFPRCVSCGTKRSPDQLSLHLHCGPLRDLKVEGNPVFADDWIPAPNTSDKDDLIHASVAATWSALDCPSAAPIADPDSEHPVVLARLAVRIVQRPLIGKRHVLAAWHITSNGRKHSTRSVLIDDAGKLLAVGDALWIELRPK